MRSTSSCCSLVFLITILLIGCFYSALIPEVSAWNNPGLIVNPLSRTTKPGSTVTYNIQVKGSTPHPNEHVFLDYLILHPGITASLSVNSKSAPFSSVLTVQVSSSTPPGTYSFPVKAKNVNPPPPDPVIEKEVTVEINVILLLPTPIPTPLPITDWALSSPSLSPPSPVAGDPVTFSAVLQALSTGKPYPQSVKVNALLDGMLISSGTLSYPGPTGNIVTVSSSPPWVAAEGTHTITWIVDPPPPGYNDPNMANNQASLTFTVGPQPQPFDFSITAQQTSQTIKAGETATFPLSINLVSGSPSTVTLAISDVPTGATPTFSPSQGEPTCSSTLTITTNENIPQDTYTLTITGSGGGITKTTTITLSIETPLEPDFELSVFPTSRAVTPPQSTSCTVSILKVGDFTSNIALTISELPEGVQASFTPQSDTPDYTSILTLSSTQITPPGTYTLIIYASGDGKTKSTTVEFIVNEASTSTPTPTPTSTETGVLTGLESLTEQWELLVIVLLVIVIIVLGAILLKKRQSKQKQTHD